MTLSPFKYYGYATLAGVSATLALPPFQLISWLIPAFVGLLWLLDRAPSKRAQFFVGWWFGLGHFVTGLYWFAIALLTDPEKFAWLIPFAVFGISSVLALYTGLVTWLMARLPFKGVRRVLVFGVVWTVTEYARGHLFTGFPWNLIGYSWMDMLQMLQFASVVGIYGLSLVTVWMAAMPVVIMEQREFLPLHVRLRPCYAMLALGILLYGFGMWRLKTHPTAFTETSLRIVQANIKQDHKWDPELRFQTFKEHITLTKSPALHPFSVVIWPESAVPYTLEAGSPLRALITSALPEGAVVITGALRAEEKGEKFKLWNSLFMLGQKGESDAFYDKAHLVPFGEYIPLRFLLPAELVKITYGDTDFSAGPGPKTLRIGNIPPLSPLICYEGIFPGQVVSEEAPPAWMVNITNDAWFGRSSGPYQHMAMVQMRAIEEGIPLVRAANTGISAIVDAYGRVTAKLPLGAKAVLDGMLPEKAPMPTLYGRFGDALFFLLAGCAIAMAFGKRLFGLSDIFVRK